MTVLITASGSHGDVYPFIALGHELKSRGHDVTLFASGYFESLVGRAGLSFSPIGTAEDYLRILAHPNITHPTKGFGIVVGSLLDTLPQTYRQLADAVDPDNTILVGSSLAFPSRLLQETDNIPGVTVHLAPSVFRSAIQAARVGPIAFPGWMPASMIRGLYSAVDRFALDPVIAPRLNPFRQTLGLPPVRRAFNSWIHSPDLTIGLFPDWFAAPAPDWPSQVHITGFPLYDQPEDGLSPDVESYLAGGEPPLLFTTGTATMDGREFFAESVDACRLSGRRGLLLSRFPDQLPSDLPVGVRHFSHEPFSLLFPRCAAVVHHGGIGTTSQALRAGVPQLIRPMAFDQFDNARCLIRLGVARELFVSRYKSRAIARDLERLISDPTIAAACSRVQTRLHGHDAVSSTCDLLENLFENLPNG